MRETINHSDCDEKQPIQDSRQLHRRLVKRGKRPHIKQGTIIKLVRAIK